MLVQKVLNAIFASISKFAFVLVILELRGFIWIAKFTTQHQNWGKCNSACTYLQVGEIIQISMALVLPHQPYNGMNTVSVINASKHASSTNLRIAQSLLW